MANVLIVAYLLIVLALIAVILLQRSEGGGLGMGTSSAGIMTVRGSANLLTRTTAVLAALFMATAIGLTILNELDRGSGSILDRADAIGEGGTEGGNTTVLDALNALGGGASDNSLAIPDSAPAAGSGDGDAVETPAEEAAPAADPSLAVPDQGSGAAPVEDQSGTGEVPAAPVD